MCPPRPWPAQGPSRRSAPDGPKLAKLLKQGTEAEARARLERLLGKRDALATENYVRYCIGVAAKSGFDLTRGDIALVHPEDLPETVNLVPRRDPVFAIAHPEVIKGRMLLVKKKEARKFLEHATVTH
jgi:hypothetical protein